MLFGPQPAGYADPPEAIAEIQAGMEILLAAPRRARRLAARRRRPRPAQPRQLRDWIAARAGGPVELPARVLRLGVLTWTRLHGIVSLELAGALGDMGLDGGLLVDAEVRAVVAAARGGDA